MTGRSVKDPNYAASPPSTPAGKSAVDRMAENHEAAAQNIAPETPAITE